MSNTSKNDSKIEEDDDVVNTKYQPPKVVPLKEILNQDSEDASLNKYKQQLIGTATNVIIGMFEYENNFNILIYKNKALKGFFTAHYSAKLQRNFF